MHPSKLLFRAAAVCFAAFAAPVSAVIAQEYPSREIHSIVNFPPGTGMDIMTRYYSAKLTELTSKPVIVENRPGAQGNISMEYLARSKPDGYTIMITPASGTLAAAPSFFKQLAFDPLKDFTPITALSKLGFAFAVDAKRPIYNIYDLTSSLKAKPGHGNYGTASRTLVAATEVYKSRAGLQTTQVMYTGLQDLMPDLYGGQIDFIVMDPTSLKEPAREGKVRILAITSATRASALPDVPTMAESGFPGYDIGAWIGLIAPAGLPASIVQKLAIWHRQINSTDETREKLRQFVMDPLDEDSEAMAARLRTDTERWREFVRVAKIEPH